MSLPGQRPGTAVGDEQHVLQAWWSRKDILTLRGGHGSVPCCLLFYTAPIKVLGGLEVPKEFTQWHNIHTYNRQTLRLKDFQFIKNIFVTKHLQFNSMHMGGSESIDVCGKKWRYQKYKINI